MTARTSSSLGWTRCRLAPSTTLTAVVPLLVLALLGSCTEDPRGQLAHPELVTGAKPPVLVTTFGDTRMPPTQELLLAISLDDGRELAREKVAAIVIGPAKAGVWVGDPRGGVVLRDAATLKIIADTNEILRRNPQFTHLWRRRGLSGGMYHKQDQGLCVATPAEEAHAYVVSPDRLMAREVPHDVMDSRECVSQDGMMTPSTETSRLLGRQLGFIGEGAAKVLADGGSPLNPRARYVSPRFINGRASDGLGTVVLSNPESVLIAHVQAGRLWGDRWALSRVSVSDGRVLWTDTQREKIVSLARTPTHLVVRYGTVLAKVDIVTGKRVWTYRYKP
jgi:hypothetical protein